MPERIHWTEAESAAFDAELVKLAPLGLTLTETVERAMSAMPHRRPIGGGRLVEHCRAIVKRERMQIAKAQTVNGQPSAIVMPSVGRPKGRTDRGARVYWNEAEVAEFKTLCLAVWRAHPDRDSAPVASVVRAALARHSRPRPFAVQVVAIASPWVKEWRAHPPAEPVNVEPAAVDKPSAANPFPHVPLPGQPMSATIHDITDRLARAVLADASDDDGPATLGERARTEAVQFGVDVLTEVLRSPAVRAAIADLAKVAVGRAEVAAVASTETWQSNAALPQTKVLIAGLRGHQLTAVLDAHKDKFNIRFWETGKSKDQLKQDAKSAHIVIGITKFLSHSADAICKGNARKYIRHAGGMTPLNQLLDMLAQSHAPGMAAAE